MYVYIESEKGLFTAGFYAPNGEWKSESDHETRRSAVRRVIQLNGGHLEDDAFPGRENIV